MRRLILPAVPVLFMASFILADGPADNVAEKVRQVPPPGIKLTDMERAELAIRVVDLHQQIDDLRDGLESKPALLELLPDVQVYHHAVHYALKYDEFFSKFIDSLVSGGNTMRNAMGNST